MDKIFKVDRLCVGNHDLSGLYVNSSTNWIIIYLHIFIQQYLFVMVVYFNMSDPVLTLLQH